jgi:nucleoside-diphosphate-sugar epimerase
MIKNIVIGSEGFVGNKLCSYLEKIGEEVTRFDIKRGPNEDARTAIINFSNVDRIYFLAWDVGGAKYLYDETAQKYQLEWNLELLSNLMPQIEKSKKPFLFISSQLAEECDTVYGVTKRLGEVWTKLIDGVFVRQWNVYGPIEKEGVRSHVISDLVTQAIKTKEIKIMTTGEEKRQFIYIDDVCKAWHLALENNLKGKYDITSFEWVKIIDVANIIGRLTGAKVIPGKIIGSTPITPIKGKIPGWFPEIGLEEGLKKMIDNYKE